MLVLRSMSVSQSLAVPPAVMSPLMCVYPTVRNSSVTRRARKQSSPFFGDALTDAGAFVGFFVNANSTLNQWPLGHEEVSHVCNGEADVDSRRVFMSAQLEGVAICSKAMKRLSVRCAQVAQPGISLKALNWSFRSRSRRTMCVVITVHEQARPDIRVAMGKKCSAGTLHALCKSSSG